MLPVLVLILSLCNAHWAIEGFGYDEVDPFPGPPEQPDYDKGSQLVQNIANLNIPDVTVEDKAPEREILSRNQDLKLPDVDNDDGVLYLPTSTSSESEDDMRNAASDTSDLSKLMEDVTMSKYSSYKYKVTKLANDSTALRNDTDQLMDQLNLLYIHLAVDESDNVETIENSYKYGMSVILRFLFEFYRIFRKLSSQQPQTELQLKDVDIYGASYDRAVDVLKQEREYSPLDISTPVRRSINIFQGILYESVIITQAKCSTSEPNWKCILVYLASVLNEADNCPNVWYHAFVHLLSLVKIGIQDSFVYNIASLDKFRELAYFENIFDFIVEKIQEYKEVGRVQLSIEAIFFTVIADLQESGLLNCIYVDYLYD